MECHFGGNGGIVKLRIEASETSLVEEGDSVLKGWIEFRLAGKGIKKRSREFNAESVESWRNKLRAASDKLRIEPEKYLIGQYPENVWTGKYADLVDKVAESLCNFLKAFRPYMAVQKTAGGAG